MENLKASSKISRQTITICLTITFSLISVLSFSQNVVDFSGKWVLNQPKSSSLFADVSSIYIITQTNNTINIDLTQSKKDTKPVTSSEKYVIGSGMEGKSGNKNITVEVAWSSDKQSFSITEVTSYAENGTTRESKRIKTYSLTDAGKTMIIKTDNIPSSGSKTTDSDKNSVMVFNKSL